jgi:hypothetical protein
MTAPRPGIGDQSAGRVVDLTVDDPHALVRIGPQQLVGGRPAGMLGLGVPLQIPGADEPLAAALDRAAPLSQGWPGSWRPSSVLGWA